MITDIQKVQTQLEDKYVSYIPLIDKAAETLYNNSQEKKARNFITQYSVNEANSMTRTWKELGKYLLVKYLDGNIKKEKNGTFERTEFGLPASPIFAGYPDWWYRIIVNSTVDNFKVMGDNH